MRGIGICARVASRRTIAWSPGACASSTGCAPYIISTSLSENQYETTFMIAARTNAMIMPCSPAIA